MRSTASLEYRIYMCYCNTFDDVQTAGFRTFGNQTGQGRDESRWRKMHITSFCSEPHHLAAAAIARSTQPRQNLRPRHRPSFALCCPIPITQPLSCQSQRCGPEITPTRGRGSPPHRFPIRDSEIRPHSHTSSQGPGSPPQVHTCPSNVEVMQGVHRVQQRQPLDGIPLDVWVGAQVEGLEAGS